MKYFSCMLLIILLPACWVNAQVQEQLSPTEKRYQSVVTEPLTIYKGFFRAGETVTFSFIDKMFDSRSKKILVESNGLGRIWSFASFLQYGISDRLQAEIQIPYEGQSLTLSTVYEFQNPDTSYVSKHSNPTKGLGDISVSFVYQLIHGSYTKPFLGLYVTANIPTGEKNPTHVNIDNPQEYNYGPGKGAFSFVTSLRFRKISFPYLYFVTTKLLMIWYFHSIVALMFLVF